MRIFTALVLCLLLPLSFAPGCASADPSILASTINARVGTPTAPVAVAGFDWLSGTFVLVLNGEAEVGAYRLGTDVPSMVNGRPLEASYAGAKIILVQLAGGEDGDGRRLELAPGEPVPIEWQGAVRAALRPSVVLALEAAGTLLFAPQP